MQELTDTCAGVNASSCDFTSSRSFNLLPVQSLWLSVLPILLSPSLGPSCGLSAAGLCSYLAVC